MEPWQIMWGLAIAIFFACKWITWRQAGSPLTTLAAGYWFLWPGLDATAFFGDAWSRELEAVPPKTALAELNFAVAKMLAGIAILIFLCRLVSVQSPYSVGWVGMVGIIMTLHFGLFHAMSCVWRAFGVDAEPLMNWPILADSLADFWGKRWNTAFRNLTHRFIFRPLIRRLGGRSGGRWAVVVGFFFSGLIHDLVISMPAGSGYGGPTVYFMIQAMGLLLERRFGKNRLATMITLILPLPWLFHEPFVTRVVVPFLRAIGSIP